MRTVKIEDLQKLAQVASSSELLVTNTASGDLFSADHSTVFADYATKVSLGTSVVSLGNQLRAERVSLGNSLRAEDSRIVSLCATKVSLGNLRAYTDSVAVSLGNLQVSLGNVQVSIGTLATRITQLENFPPTPSNSISPVTWQNLTEINLSGEKLTNGDFSSSGYVQDTNFCLTQACGLSPNNGSVNDHTFAVADRPKIIALQTTSSAPLLTAGDIYRINAVNTVNEGIYIEDLNGNALGWATGGLRGSVWEVVSLSFDNWTVTSGTLDETKLASGIVKGDGGQVSIQQTLSQNIAQGTDLVIKVTSDDDITFYPILSNGVVDNGNSFDVLASEGYAEHTTQSVVSGFRISTVNGTREYSSVSVFQGAVAGGSVLVTNGSIRKISGTTTWNAGASSVESIEGSTDGYVQFQFGRGGKGCKVGLTYLDQDYRVQDFEWTTTGGGHTQYNNQPNDPINHPNLVGGEWFRIRHFANNNTIEFQRKQKIYGQNGELLGEDFITYHTSSQTTDGRNLYVDVSFLHIDAQLNDVAIVTA